MGLYTGLVLYSDYDGTLTGPGDHLYEENVEAIARFQADGGRFSLATGKTLADYHLLPIRANAPLILSNGAEVFDPESGRWLRRLMIPRESLAVLDRIYAEVPAAGLNARAGDEVVSYRVNEDLIDVSSTYWYHGLVPIDDKTGLSSGVSMMTVYGSEDDLRRAREVVTAEFPELTCTISYPGFLNVMLAGATKGEGLECVLASGLLGGCPLVMTVGDGENDIGLLKGADVSFAIGDADETLLAAADVILEGNGSPSIPQILSYVDETLLGLAVE